MKWIRQLLRLADRSQPAFNSDGRRAFEQFFGSLADRRRTWQAVAIATLTINVVLTVGYVLVSLQHRVVPYVVEVDVFGEVRLASQLALEAPPERAVVAALRRFVHNLRTVPTDVHLLNTRLNAAKAHAAGPALETMAQAVRDEETVLQRMLRTGQARYVTEVSSVLRVPGNARIYRVVWREKHETDERTVEGYFEMRVQPPENESQLLENPLGIFITDYTLSKSVQ